MKTYEGYFENGVPLARIDVDGRKHQCDGRRFCCSRAAGTAQLALAILADFFDDDKRALRTHREYALQVLRTLPQKEAWRINQIAVRDRVVEITRWMSQWEEHDE